MSDEGAEGNVDIGGGTSTTTEAQWYGDGLSDEQVGYLQNKGWDKPDGAIKVFDAYVEFEKFKGVGEDELLRIPKGDDTEGLGKAYSRLGRPEKAEDYVFNTGDGTDETEIGWFKEALHEMGASSSKATEFFDKLTERVTGLDKASEEAMLQERTENLAELRSRWGVKADERMELANRVLRKFNVDDEKLESIRDTLGFAKTIEIFADIGGMMHETKVQLGEETDTNFGNTVEQHKANREKLKQELIADPVRNAMFLQGKGSDVEKMRSINDTIAHLQRA